MPLIFGDRKKLAAVASGGSSKEYKSEAETDEKMRVLQTLAKDIMDANANGSASDMARALKAFFLQVDSEPHREGEHK